MDRNICFDYFTIVKVTSLSARRAWIEMLRCNGTPYLDIVALRKESVDRNTGWQLGLTTAS